MFKTPSRLNEEALVKKNAWFLRASLEA